MYRMMVADYDSPSYFVATAAVKLGFFKKELTRDEKAELLEAIEAYRRSLTPLVVPLTLIKHYVRKYDVDYLARQVFLSPYPAELMLRNHV